MNRANVCELDSLPLALTVAEARLELTTFGL